MNCTCKVGPGKFEGEGVLTFLAYHATLDGCADETTGDSERGDLTDWLRGPLQWEPEDLRLAGDYGYCAECREEAQAGGPAGIAVWETDQGFVGSRSFDTEEEYAQALAEAQADDESASEGE